uniref:UbiA family prenyltransferase n=1 Tax=Shewanella gaetbuli TaxID=220752 RepID=UPI003B5ACA95
MIKSYLQLVRAPNGLTAISNILAAAVIVSAGQLPIEVCLLIIASLSFYYGGMVLNDCFDFQEDSEQRPQRPLPSRQIPLSKAWCLGFSLLLLGLIVATFSSTQYWLNFSIALGLSACIILYNSIIKEGMTGSIMMGLCRYFNWCLGFLVLGMLLPQFNNDVLFIALPIFFYITGLTFISKQETHAQNRNAIAVLTTLIIAAAISMISLVFMLPEYFMGSKAIVISLCLAWITWLMLHVFNTWKNFTASSIQQLVMTMIIGVIPLDALLVTMSGQYLWGSIILLLLFPCRWLSKKLYMT